MLKLRSVIDIRLVRNWEFLRPAAAITPGLGGDIDPLKLLKRRSSLVVADLPVSPVAQQTPSDMKSKGHRHQQSPTVFEEPDVNSLLDSFGF
jgi:hypothetical protein